MPHTPLRQMEVDSILFRHYAMDHWPSLKESKEEIARLVKRGRGNLDDIDAILAARLQIEWNTPEKPKKESSGCDE